MQELTQTQKEKLEDNFKEFESSFNKTVSDFLTTSFFDWIPLDSSLKFLKGKLDDHLSSMRSEKEKTMINNAKSK